MDCPNCGVYNPEDRHVCWRCDKELPRPKPEKKRKNDPVLAQRRMWIIVAVVLVIWILMTWLLPMLLGNGGSPLP